MRSQREIGKVRSGAWRTGEAVFEPLTTLPPSDQAKLLEALRTLARFRRPLLSRKSGKNKL